MKRTIALLATLSLAVSGVLTYPAYADEIPEPPAQSTAISPESDGDATALDQPRRVLVMLKDQPQGKGDESAGLAAVDRVIKRWQNKDGFSLRRKFGSLVRAFSAELPESQLDFLATDPGVASVKILKVYYPTMQTAGELTKSVSARKNLGVDGAGLVVSVIDTGIDPTHRDMRLEDGAAKKLSPEGSKTTDKVPYGWNYADENDNFVDTTSSMHGMHVAGIVAANGGADANVETNGRITGIAPNAQLLAMKVFSNDPSRSGAQEDDIIAAIEDSVKHGADIINMSLGSPNGTSQSDIGEGRAIANAQAAGVQVVVAAGNDGINGSAANTIDSTEMLDDGTLGHPASTRDALSVASITNSHAIATRAQSIVGTSTQDIGYQLQTGSADGAEHTIVSGGLGRPTDIPDAATGNYVLIERGALSFADKFANAIAKGATGVLIYNSAVGGETFQGMSGLNDVTIPGGFLFRSVGEKLEKQIADNGGSIKIRLTNDPLPISLGANALAPSAFTSWGATPELDFKPELAAIGGSVYSTLNNNQYGTNSGTSMATPHVAGAFALGLQKYKELYPNLTQQEQNKLLRTALSNTAKILEHNTTPYAPRQIGAGLIQTENAINTKVFATVNNQPNAALHEIHGPTTITITLANKGNKEYTFQNTATCVLAESQQPGQENTTTCNNNETITTNTPTTTVKPNQTTTIDYTLTPTTNTNHWTQGWIKLTSQDPTQPSLTIPYLGFVGDWNQEPIIDYPKDSGKTPLLNKILGDSHPHRTELASRGKFGFFPTTWFSPNGDGNMDIIFPRFVLLRCARDVEFEILKDGEVLQKVGADQDLQRRPLRRFPSASSAANSGSTDSWDGKIYNPDDNTFVTVNDSAPGEYTFRIRARLSKDYDWQITDLPFGVDTAAPTSEISFTTKNNGDRVYTVKAIDDRAGVDELQAKDGLSGNRLFVTALTDSSFEVTVPSSLVTTDSYLQLDLSDKAGNILSEQHYYQDREFRVTNAGLLNRWIGKGSDPALYPKIENDKATIEVSAKDSVARITVNGVEAALENGIGSAQIPIVEGRQDIVTKAFASDGSELGEVSHWLGYDLVPPVIEFTQLPLNASGELVLDSDGTAQVAGRITDNLAGPDQLLLFDSSLELIPHDAATGEFSAKVKPLEDSPSYAIIVADHPSDNDLVNLTFERWMIEGRSDGGTGQPVILFDDPALQDLSSPYGSRVYVVDNSFQNLEKISDDVPEGSPAARLTLKGTFSPRPGSFKVAGKEVPLDSENRFEVPIDLINGITHVGYAVTDASGKPVIESSWRFMYDDKLPGFTLTTEPGQHPDGAIYLAKSPTDIKVSGEVWDNEFGYKMAVNGSVLRDFLALREPGQDVNRRPYETVIAGATGNQFMNITLIDAQGNGFEQTILLVLDDAPPKLSIAGPPSVTTRDAEFTITTEDKNLQSLQVEVDGKAVASEIVEVRPHPKAKVVEMRGGEPRSSRQDTERNSADTAKLLLTVRLSDVPGLLSGNHVLMATATDKAGNATPDSVVFRLDEPPVITGPDQLDIVHAKDWAEQIRSAYQATDQEDGQIELQFDLGKLLVGVPTDLELRASDSAGNLTARIVKVTLQPADGPDQPGDPGQPDIPGNPRQPDIPGKRPGLPKTGN